MPANINPLFASSSMPNGYFNYLKDYAPDKKLTDSLIAETYFQRGIYCDYFVVSYDTNKDPIFSEDSSRTVLRKFETVIYYPDLHQEIDQLGSKFGIFGLDIVTAHSNISHFTYSSTYSLSSDGITPIPEIFEEYVPRAGDFVRLKYNNNYMEIVSAKKSESGQFMQHQFVYTFEMKAMASQHFSISADSISLSGDQIWGFMDIQNTDDILNISAAVSKEYEEIKFDSTGQKPTQDYFSGW